MPISIVTSEAVNFLISTIIIIAFVLGDGLSLSKYILLYPLVFIIQYILILGIAFIVSSVTVYFRDLQHLIGVALQLLFYGTPIVYSIDSIPENFAWILNLNPMTYIINAYRDIFYNQVFPDIKGLLIILVVSIVICIVGYMIFNKLQKRFAEEL